MRLLRYLTSHICSAQNCAIAFRKSKLLMAVRELVFVLFVIVIASIGIATTGLHSVPEGHVGVYWFGGALMDRTTFPGFHFQVPLLSRVEFVQVTLQTDTVRDIPCGTSGGVVIYFDKIEVVNRLSIDKVHNTIKQYGPHYDKTWIFDKIHHEINQFCSSHSLQEVYITEFELLDEELATALQSSCTQWDTGIEIIAIRVTKPRIPESVRKNYELVEEQKTKLLIAAEQQRVTQKEEETIQITLKMRAKRDAEITIIEAEKNATIAMIDAQRLLNTSVINVQQMLAEKEGSQKAAEIQNQIFLASEKAKADALLYSLETEAAGNQLKLTPEFLQYSLYNSLTSNTKFYFGDSIPQAFGQFPGLSLGETSTPPKQPVKQQ